MYIYMCVSLLSLSPCNCVFSLTVPPSVPIRQLTGFLPTTGKNRLLMHVKQETEEPHTTLTTLPVMNASVYSIQYRCTGWNAMGDVYNGICQSLNHGAVTSGAPHTTPGYNREWDRHSSVYITEHVKMVTPI